MVAVAGLLSDGAAVEPASVPEVVALGAVAALPLGALEGSAASIGVAREATSTVAARTARVRFIKGSPFCLSGPTIGP